MNIREKRLEVATELLGGREKDPEVSRIGMKRADIREELTPAMSDEERQQAKTARAAKGYQRLFVAITGRSQTEEGGK